MRCKVRLESVTKTMNGCEVILRPVTSGSQENQTFFKYTPYGEIKLGTINEAIVDKMTVGKEYYADFVEAQFNISCSMCC